MRRWPIAVLSAVVLWGFCPLRTSMAMTLFVSGQPEIFVDTNTNGCPDDGDGGCSASVDIPPPPPPEHSSPATNAIITPADHATLTVSCMQPVSMGTPIQGLSGNPMFMFNLLNFSQMNQSGEVSQMPSMGVNPKDLILDGKGFMQEGQNGPVHVTEIQSLRGTSSGVLCNEGGPAALVRPPKGPAMLFSLDEVNCNSCPCSPDSQNPTHLKVMVPFKSVGGGLVERDVYIPLEMGALTLSADATNLGNIVLNDLGFCPGRSGAPTTTDWGLMLLIVGLLSVGTWAIGRRASFAESVPLL